jgi:hypothetical protein
MIEFALVLPLLALLAFGTAEMGLAWVAHNRVEGAVSTAARVGASSGGVPEADVNILTALRTALPDESLDNLDRVIIFKPTNDDGGVPPQCMKPMGSANQQGLNNWCNTYSGATVRGFDETGPDPLGPADNFWLGNSTQRPDSLAGPPEDIGVWVRTIHHTKTGTFFDDLTITRTSIYRLQPDIDG